MEERIPPYWTRKDVDALDRAETFEELLAIAMRIIDRMKQPISMVCGPITSGGTGSVERNLEIFNFVIQDLVAGDENIFNQLIFERPMWRILATPYHQGGNHLLEAFYLPIFKSGRIAKLYFLPGWQSSGGASWEHETALRLGIEIVCL